MESTTLNVSDIADCPPSENSLAEALRARRRRREQKYLDKRETGFIHRIESVRKAESNTTS